MASSMFAPPHLDAGDQLWLCAHDAKGRLRLTARAFEDAAASALLGEMVNDEYLKVVGDHVRLRKKGRQLLKAPRPPRFTVVRWLLEQISGSPNAVVSSWITDIAQYAPQWIANRLVKLDMVQVVQPSRLAFWRPARYAPVDLNGPHHLGDHLWMALQRRSALTVVDVFLAGLLQATQLHRTVVAGLPHLDGLISAELGALANSTDPEFSARDRSLSALVTHTRHLITTAALAQTL